jgi:TonB family protein
MSMQFPSRVLAGLFLGLVLRAPLAAQNRLYVQEPDDKFHAVSKVSGIRPYIMQNGKQVAAKGQRLILRKVEEYLPTLITVRDKDTRPTNVSVDYGNAPTNNGVHFSAKFEAADLLSDVFIVVEVAISNVGQKVYVYEIGQLEPHTPKAFSADLALGQYMGIGQIDIHLFVGGNEVFHSEQPAAYRDEQLDRIVAKRIAGVQQAGPKPFYGTTPAYPAALRGSGLKGEAVVTMRISEQGRVLEPVLERATEPPFGEEALAAVRQWRFVPRVQEGRAVETKVSIPFAFDPPKAGEGKR